MKKRASYLIILFIALLSAVQSMAQSSQPDVVCMGTSKNYYVDATSGSSYIWKINGGSPETSTTNSVDINWTTSGIYTLTVQEITKDNCLGPVQSLQVTVNELPTLQLTSEIGTESQTICLGGAIKKVTYSFGGGATGVTVTGLPDGVNSVVNGTTVTLNGIPTASGNYTITTVGGAPCAEASLNGSIAVNQLSTATISGTTITCQNAASPVVTFTGTGGTAPYTFTYNINDGTNKTVTTTTGDTVTVSVPTSFSGTFAYNLVDVTDSRGCTNGQTGTATITINAPTSSPPIKRVVCPLQLPFSWNNISCQDAGTYTARLTNSVGCDSTATLELIVESPMVTTSVLTICPSELPYLWNGMSFTKSGTYTTDLKTPAGCDSVTTLILNVNQPTSAMKAASVCEGETYEYNGIPFSAPGSYSVKLQNSVGCDSIVTLVLNSVAGSNISQVVRLLPGETYTVNGKVYDREGVYTEIIKTDACDSIVVTEVSFINIPNTLTPNGDGANDLFMKDSHVKVYNRNGVLLFDGTSGWDGKYKNRYVSNDTYFYVLFTDDSRVKTIEGYITVVR